MNFYELLERLDEIKEELFQIKTEMLRRSTDAVYIRKLAKRLEKIL